MRGCSVCLTVRGFAPALRLCHTSVPNPTMLYYIVLNAYGTVLQVLLL